MQTADLHRYYEPADCPESSPEPFLLRSRTLKRSVPPIPFFECLRSPLYPLVKMGLTARIMPFSSPTSNRKRHDPNHKGNMLYQRASGVDSLSGHSALLRSPAPQRVTTSPGFIPCREGPAAHAGVSGSRSGKDIFRGQLTRTGISPAKSAEQLGRKSPRPFPRPWYLNPFSSIVDFIKWRKAPAFEAEAF